MSAELKLRPLPFHDALADALQELEPGLWRWFASDDYGQKYADTVKVELLRSTYRVPRESSAQLYGIADEVARALGVEVPISLYQAQEDGTMNAALIFTPREAHVVLRGPVIENLSESELRALLGHELAHHKLWTEANGKFKTADSLIEHIAGHQRGAPSHVSSALRHRRWTEVYADRGSLVACGELWPAIACLVKMSTGLRQVDARAYLAQAEETLGESAPSRVDGTHPESFVRAFALKAWHSGGDEDAVRRLVEGPHELDQLDLLQQRQLLRATQDLLAVVLQPEWMRSEGMLAHARRFFPDVTFAGAPASFSLAGTAESIAEYLAYVLLDFGMVDPEIEEVSLAYVAHLASELGVSTVFAKVARKELRMSAANYGELEKRGAELAKRADQPTLDQVGAAS